MVKAAMVTRQGVPMTRSGFCQWPSAGSHGYCHERQLTCACPCHSEAQAPSRAGFGAPLPTQGVSGTEEEHEKDAA